MKIRGYRAHSHIFMGSALPELSCVFSSLTRPKSQNDSNMAASRNWGGSFPSKRVLLFGVYIRAPEFWTLPYKGVALRAFLDYADTPSLCMLMLDAGPLRRYFFVSINWWGN